jgi:hypothetical protein
MVIGHVAFSIIGEIKLRRIRWQRCEMHIKFEPRKPERKSALGRRRCRWEDTIKIDIIGIGYECRCRWEHSSVKLMWCILIL